MSEVKFNVPSWLEGISHMPTTLPGIALFAAPYVLDFFYPGAANTANKIVSALGGLGFVLSTGDTKPTQD